MEGHGRSVIAINKSAQNQLGHENALLNESGVHREVAHALADGHRKLVESKGKEDGPENVALLHTTRNRTRRKRQWEALMNITKSNKPARSSKYESTRAQGGG